METDDIKNAIYRVTQQVGYHGPEIRPVPSSSLKYAEMVIDGGRMNLLSGSKHYTLFYSDDATQYASMDELEASIAHEIGHVLNGDITVPNNSLSHEASRRMEILADQFAARHGYGDKLKSFLAKVKETPDYAEGTTHPTFVDRVKAIEEVSSVQLPAVYLSTTA